MKHVTSSRRQIVMGTLLSLAVLGAIMRILAPEPSLARDIGTLLLVLWLPAVGNLIAFLVRQWHLRKRGAVARFDSARGFSAQLLVRMSPVVTPGAMPGAVVGPHDTVCTIVVGNEGFSARTGKPLAQLLARGADNEVELEFLRPELALPRLAPGTRFPVLVGRVSAAQGTVVGPSTV
jgi:hypothetical protein